jgi:taurine dioxygenase
MPPGREDGHVKEDHRAMGYNISPLPGQPAFGAWVTDLTPDDLDAPKVQARLRALWIDAGVIVFRGLKGGEESHLRLSRIFGKLIDHPLYRGRPDYHPELIELVYDGAQEIYEVEGKAVGAWLPWHSDLIYTDEINRGGILRPVELPARGGGLTGFIDRIHAYATLPEDLKQRVDGLDVLYKPFFDATVQRFGRAPGLKLVRGGARMMEHNAENRPRTVHPLVYTQAETGRKVLNVSPWFADGILGMENAEGDALLKAVIEHCIQPKLAYFHEWRAEDMVLWDNWRMMHSATGVAADDRRRMRRTTIAGDYALGRVEHAGAVIPDEQRISV